MSVPIWPPPWLASPVNAPAPSPEPTAQAPSEWDQARADAALSEVSCRIDALMAQRWRTEIQGRVLEVFRCAFRRYHERHDPLLWQALDDLRHQVEVIWGAKMK